MTLLLAFLRRRVVSVAIKAAVACGIAFYLGSLLPSPVDEYQYYAALGAFTVVGLVLVDSVKESVQVFGAVSVGVGVALVAQSVSWANAVTVAVTIAVCVLLGRARLFGVQRTWAPMAGLFVLAAGGADPQPMALGYLVQLPLGAVVGVLVNALLLAPLGDEDLEPASTAALRLLTGQLRSYADVLEDQAADDDADAAERRDEVIHTNVVELEQAQARLRSAIAQARRGTRGNPRARLHAGRQAAELDRALAVSRCVATLLAVGVVLGQSTAARGEQAVAMRRQASETLRQAAEVFADPDAAREQPGLLEATERSIDRMLAHARSSGAQDGLNHVLFGALALTIRECLETFARDVADIDVPGGEGP